MNWFTLSESQEIVQVTESRTVTECSRVLAGSVNRWLLSGRDLPDANSTDGISEHEAAEYAI